MEKFGKAIVKARYWIVALSILLLIPAAIGFIKTRINYDILYYLPKEIETMKGQDVLMDEFCRADIIVSVSPSYWADIPGQFKAFIDRCTPWCNTHEPHGTIPPGKKGYAIALRTGPGMKECERIIGSIEHFYGHLEIGCCGHLGLCSVETKEAVEDRKDEIRAFCDGI